MIVIGEVIKKLRKEQGIPARELSRRSGISQGYLSQLETGKNNNPTTDILRKLASGLGISYVQLMNEAGEVPRVNSLFEAFGLSADGELLPSDKVIPVTLFLPAHQETYDENGGHVVTKNYPKDMRKKIFDLNELLNMDIELYYKGEILTKDKRDKIKTLLKTILE